MVDLKDTGLAVATDALPTDILRMGSDPGGSPISKQITYTNAFKRFYSAVDAKEFAIDNVGDITHDDAVVSDWSDWSKCKWKGKKGILKVGGYKKCRTRTIVEEAVGEPEYDEDHGAGDDQGEA